MNKLKPFKNRIKGQNSCLSSRAKILALLIFASSFSIFNEAKAASWEWLSIGNDKERVIIKLDEPMPDAKTTRKGAKNVEISTPLDIADIVLSGARGAGEYVENIKLEDGKLDVTFKKSGFGYILTQPSSSVILLEIYEDPMMLRFYPETEAGSVAQPSLASPQTANTPNVDTSSPRTSSQVPSLSDITPNNASNVENRPVQGDSLRAPNVQRTAPVIPNANTELEPKQDIAPSDNSSGLSNPDNSNKDTFRLGPQTLALATKEDFDKAQEVPTSETALVDEPSNNTLLAQNEEIDAIEIGEASHTNAEPAPIATNPSIPRPSINVAPRRDFNQNQFAAPRPVIPEPPKIEETVSEPVEPVPTGPIYYGNNFKAEFKKDVLSSDPAAKITKPTEVMQSEQQNPYQFNATFTKGTEGSSTPTASQDAPVSTEQPQPTSQTPVDHSTAPVIPSAPVIPTAPTQASETETAELAEEVVEKNADEAQATPEANTLVPTDMTGKPLDPNLVPTMPTTIEEAIAQNRPIVYQDADGNPVPPPPDPKVLIPLVRETMDKKAYTEALPIYETLLNIRLSKDDNEHIKLKEEMLVEYARALFLANEFDLAPVGQQLIDASLTAMNYNPESAAVPELLMMVTRAHLALGNIEDAEGYALMLTQLFPSDKFNAPFLLYMVGKEQFEQGEYVSAVNTLQIIADNFPDLPIYKDSAILQTYAFYKQGHYDKALPMVSFINLKWPDAYIEDPEFLSVVADIQIAQELYDDAAETLWVQYNLDPDNPTSPQLLNRLALLYYTLGDKEGANKVQLELINSFPESEFTPAALIRIAENTYLPANPSLDTLLDLYAQPNPRLPSITYQQVIDEFPNSDDAIESAVRLAAWELYLKNNDGALRNAQAVMQKYPQKPHYNVANEILLRAFEASLTNALEEENFARALNLWETYPEVQNYYQPFEDDLRVALARGYLNRGETQTGLDMLAQFISPEQNEKYGIYAYNLFLSEYLNAGNWSEILTLDDNVKNWNMPLDVRNQHRYTVALAAENSGLPNRALPLWEELVDEESIPLYQRAYANYFLARDAEIQQDLRQSYQHNLDALAMFEQLQDEGSEFSDPQRVRESIAALMDVTEVAGRFAESLEWLNRYAGFVPQDSPDYAGLMLREARLYRKMGDMTRWQVILEDIVAREPDSVFGEMAASELSTQAMARDIDRFIEQ